MAMFFCAWDREDGPCSVCVDAVDEADARRMASEIAKEKPQRVQKMAPGIFACEVIEEEDDDGAAYLVLEPVPHLGAALDLLEAAGEGATGAVVVDAPACQAEAEDDEGKVTTCVLVEGHDGEHVDGAGDAWSDEP